MPTCSLSRTQPTDHREAVLFGTFVDAGPCHGVDMQFTPRPCRSLSSKQQPHALVRHDRRPQWSRSKEQADSQVTFCKKREYSSNRRSARLGSRLLTARCRQPNEQSAAVDAVPLLRDRRARQRLATVSDANATAESAGTGPGWSMTTLGFDGGRGQARPAFGRARSRAFSRLSALTGNFPHLEGSNQPPSVA
jgi:hypothetical protein